jgi:hypothetical protein
MRPQNHHGESLRVCKYGGNRTLTLITLVMPVMGATAGSGTVGTGNTRIRACSQVEIIREMLPKEDLGFRSVR